MGVCIRHLNSELSKKETIFILKESLSFMVRGGVENDTKKQIILTGDMKNKSQQRNKYVANYSKRRQNHARWFSNDLFRNHNFWWNWRGT